MMSIESFLPQNGRFVSGSLTKTFPNKIGDGDALQEGYKKEVVADQRRRSENVPGKIGGGDALQEEYKKAMVADLPAEAQ